MRIQNNLMAVNAQRQYNVNDKRKSLAAEKMSSGYRVNRAADDAAGLSISEKMRAQIRGLERASANTQDAISMIQTAEGALQETTSILQRIRELSIQGANDINSPEDRMAIKAEIDQLGFELDRIAATTNFNGKYILSGRHQSQDYWPNGYNNIPNELPFDEATGRLNIQAGANTQLGDAIQMGFRGITASDLLNGHLSSQGHMTDVNWVPFDPDSSSEAGFSPNVFFSDGGGLAEVTDENGVPTHYGFLSLIDAIDSKCSYRGEQYQDFQTNNLGEFEHLTGLPLVNAMRSELGAEQNRLEHTIANLDTVRENLTASESRIRDADVAKEMISFAMDSILTQSSNAMLVQANQVPATVLALIK